MEKLSRSDNFPSKMLKILTFWSVGLSPGLIFLKPSVRFSKLSVGSVGFSVRLTSLDRTQAKKSNREFSSIFIFFEVTNYLLSKLNPLKFSKLLIFKILSKMFEV